MKRILYHGVKAYTAPLANRFQRSLQDPEKAQRRLLEDIVSDLKKTEYGAHYNIDTVEDFQRNIPLVTYDDISHWMQRQRAEEGRVMVADKVRLYEKTSGSTGPHKYIPYTAALRKSFTRMFLLWAHDLIKHIDGLGEGKFYFSVSPNFDEETETTLGIPVGLEDDAEYLGDALGKVLSPFMLSEPGIGAIRDPDAFKKTLCMSLLRCDSLETVSVWNPSFLTLVLQWIEENVALVIDEIGSDLSSERLRALQETPIDWQGVWPELKLISCWADANARPLAEGLAHYFPDVFIQGKGLLATEAPMTIPMVNVVGGVPLVTETYFEFLLDGALFTLAQLAPGKRYEVVISQRGGLYRYRMGDQVEVVSRVHKTPTLRFVGRNNRTSDLIGEKLNESFVCDVIESLPIDAGGFRSLFAVREPNDGYVLIVDKHITNSEALEVQLEKRLQEAYHYRHARALGQLSAARVVVIPTIENIISANAIQSGKTLGDMKQNYLMMTDADLEAALRIH